MFENLKLHHIYIFSSILIGFVVMSTIFGYVTHWSEKNNTINFNPLSYTSEEQSIQSIWVDHMFEELNITHEIVPQSIREYFLDYEEIHMGIIPVDQLPTIKLSWGFHSFTNPIVHSYQIEDWNKQGIVEYTLFSFGLNKYVGVILINNIIILIFTKEETLEYSKNNFNNFNVYHYGKANIFGNISFRRNIH